MFKVSSNNNLPNSASSNRNTTFTSLLASTSTNSSRPLILKSVSKSTNFSAPHPLKFGNLNGFSPIKPKNDLLHKDENQKIIKLTNGQQYKCFNTTNLLNNLKTTLNHHSIMHQNPQIFQAKPPTLTLISVKVPTAQHSITIGNNLEQSENRKRKRKQDLTVLSLKPNNENASTSLLRDHQERNTLENSKPDEVSLAKRRGDIKLLQKPINKFAHQQQRHLPHFKVSASLFKFKKSSNLDTMQNNASNLNENMNKYDEEDEIEDDDDFLDDGISDEDDDDEEDGMVSKSLMENNLNDYGDEDLAYSKSVPSSSNFAQDQGIFFIHFLIPKIYWLII
jgi:hypothetical protein